MFWDPNKLFLPCQSVFEYLTFLFMFFIKIDPY